MHTGLAQYRELLGQRWVPQLLAAGVLARLPLQMYPLAVLLLIQAQTGSYATAGTVTAAAAAGYAASAPLQGRLIDRLGQTLPLTAAAAINAAGFATFLGAVLWQTNPVVLGALAALVGISLPPVAPAQRSLWRTVLSQKGLVHTALAIDAMVLDLGLIVGPLIVTSVAAALSPMWATIVTAGMLFAGTLWFSRLEPSRKWRGAGRPSSLLGPLRGSGVRTLLGISVLTGALLGTLQVGLVAFADQNSSPEAGGILIATFGVGSLLAGLVYGGRSWPATPSNRLQVLIVGYTAGVLLLSVAWSIPIMAALTILAGAWLTPQIITIFELIPDCAPHGTVTEAYAWGITATFVGYALGNSIGGTLADNGARPTLLASAGCGALAAAFVIGRRRTLQPASARHNQPPLFDE